MPKILFIVLWVLTVLLVLLSLISFAGVVVRPYAVTSLLVAIIASIFRKRLSSRMLAMVCIAGIVVSLSSMYPLAAAHGTSAASSSVAKTTRGLEHFASKDEALQNYIKKEHVNGSIDLVTTTQGDKLLVTQQDNGSYYIGELGQDATGYYAARITNWIVFNSKGVTGAGWQFTTLDGNPYTILFRKSPSKSGFTLLSNKKYYIAVLVGHTLGAKNTTTINAMQSIRNVNI